MPRDALAFSACTIVGEKKAKVSSPLPFYRSQSAAQRILALSLVLQKPEQIRQNSEVDEEKSDAEAGEVGEELVDLPGERRSRQDDGEVLSPGLLQQQSGAFDDADPGVEEGEYSRLTQVVRVDQIGLVHQ